MVSNKSFICETCCYSTNRKYNLELHHRSLKTCGKRLKRHDETTTNQNGHDFVKDTQRNGHENDDFFVKENKMVIINDDFFVKSNECRFCFKSLSTKQRLISHEKMCCTKINPLQCPTCKKIFSTKQSKHQHIKAGKCIPVKDEKDKEIEELKQRLEEEKQKRKEAEDSKATINNYITNNYFDHSINYNNYDSLNLEHISKEDIKRLFNNCRMQYPELSEDLTRMILGPKENQSIYLPEGQKSNTCAVMKDGVEMRKPLIRVLMDLGVQTAILIRDSNVIEKNKKDIVNNQFWADNRNACGLNISDIEYMTDNDKEIVQRNKNIVLDMCDGKI
tara:strand:- start:10907 stop:11905 length:999 start_codon:yes stop_codon:yes gene_type:complete